MGNVPAASSKVLEGKQGEAGLPGEAELREGCANQPVSKLLPGGHFLICRVSLPKVPRLQLPRAIASPTLVLGFLGRGWGGRACGVSLCFKHHHRTLGTHSFLEDPVPTVSADTAHSMVTFQEPAVVGPLSAGGENTLNAICYLPLVS